MRLHINTIFTSLGKCGYNADWALSLFLFNCSHIEIVTIGKEDQDRISKARRLIYKKSGNIPMGVMCHHVNKEHLRTHVLYRRSISNAQSEDSAVFALMLLLGDAITTNSF